MTNIQRLYLHNVNTRPFPELVRDCNPFLPFCVTDDSWLYYDAGICPCRAPFG